MHICLMSDIHGNLPALEKVLSLTADVDLYISLGDVVNYAPWSNECVDLLSSLESKILLKGNHEENFLQNYYPGNNPIAQTFHSFCAERFDRFFEIDQYQISAQVSDYLLIHSIENTYVFEDTEIDLSCNTILGHSHQQFVTQRDGYHLINPGSVGQNRQWINVINYIIWDTAKNTFECKSITYNVDYVIQQMKLLMYPEMCINYYQNKKRAL